ncbi:30S ribosome-binding factor RbfA [Parvularcula sp. ZS-1/3]|uniref:Ribosome-binding factor A n=1 Tax=Parvularcula mediterranea TaxID=2732508 RepID=A0A7Y3W4S3_9PROT|nr:30S ribosome-binding factor RbfA [Parvularcula mediterranea]NNU15773.1 30S ribosome-binding factor RbfA [Parvularcula mediterranea]
MASRFSQTSKGPSQRQLRAGELIRHELAQALQRGEVHEQTLEGLNITVTEVQASPDLKHANVFVTTLGGIDVDGAVEKLNAAAPKIRHALGPKLALKFLPELRFRKDESFDHADRISELLRDPR